MFVEAKISIKQRSNGSYCSFSIITFCVISGGKTFTFVLLKYCFIAVLVNCFPLFVLSFHGCGVVRLNILSKQDFMSF